MKLFTLIALVFSFQAFATEVDTDCLAMSENREKIIKVNPLEIKVIDVKSGAVKG